MVGVGNDGVVAVDENSELLGLPGSESSRFRGRKVERNIFFIPARVRTPEGDFGGVLGTDSSDTGEEGKVNDFGVTGLLFGEGNLDKVK
jgi:hypothetical protein